MSKALLVVDVQNDFCEGGSLEVQGGAEVARRIGELLATTAGADYALVVATQDHHVSPGAHFAEEPDFLDSWPPHCVVGTDGADFHPALQPRPFQAVFRKGHYDAAYSGFEGTAEDGRSLADWLREHGIDEVEVCGLAADYCVRATALDAVAEGFRTTVLLSLTAAVAPDRMDALLDAFQSDGVLTRGSMPG